MAEGEVLQFVTQAVKPTVETRPVSEVTTSGATLNAAIPSNGGSEITACGFYYSTSENMSNKATAEFTGTPDSLSRLPYRDCKVLQPTTTRHTPPMHSEVLKVK